MGIWNWVRATAVTFAAPATTPDPTTHWADPGIEPAVPQKQARSLTPVLQWQLRKFIIERDLKYLSSPSFPLNKSWNVIFFSFWEQGLFPILHLLYVYLNVLWHICISKIYAFYEYVWGFSELNTCAVYTHINIHTFYFCLFMAAPVAYVWMFLG